jgi:hypothetical protein
MLDYGREFLLAGLVCSSVFEGGFFVILDFWQVWFWCLEEDFCDLGFLAGLVWFSVFEGGFFFCDFGFLAGFGRPTRRCFLTFSTF